MGYDRKVIAHAAACGIAEDELPLIIDGCSGGVSWAYGLVGKRPSFLPCCQIHDIDYQCGGSEEKRKEVDLRFRVCAGSRGGWRAARAWVMWAFVRRAGRWSWAGESRFMQQRSLP